MDPTQSMIGSPDQGMFTAVSPPPRMRFIGRGRRRRFGYSGVRSAPAPEYSTIATAVPPAVASLSTGYRPSPAPPPPPGGLAIFGSGIGTSQIAATSVASVGQPDPIARAREALVSSGLFRFAP